MRDWRREEGREQGKVEGRGEGREEGKVEEDACSDHVRRWTDNTPRGSVTI